MRAVVIALAASLAATVPAGAQTTARPTEAPVWHAAETLRQDLFTAQTELIADDTAAAAAAVQQARRAYDGRLRAGIAAADPASDRVICARFARADTAARAGDDIALAAGRGALRADILRASAAVTLAAVGRRDVATAREWLLLRDFRTATRVSRPGADATLAIDRLARRSIAPATARLAITKDLFDGYQSRLRELLDEAQDSARKDYPSLLAEQTAQAAGYWSILSPRLEADRGAAARRETDGAFAALAAAGRRADAAAIDPALKRIRADLAGFVAAPLTPDEGARRANQLTQFLELVPVEYGRGVSDGEVTKDFEIQEAVTFRDGAQAAFGDLEDKLARRDRAATTKVATLLTSLRATLAAAAEGEQVASPTAVQAAATEAVEELDRVYPQAWKERNDAADFDLVGLTLDRMQAAASAGQFKLAEGARLEAYAFFEFGPELRLKPFDPTLAAEIEALFWFGDGDADGFAELISARAKPRAFRETRRALGARLTEAQAALGDAASRTTVVTNAALIVFREGLEAVLILAAITASFVGARRRLRAPVLIGAGLGLVVSLITWVLAQTVLGALSRYGEKLEAVVGLIAVGVLLLITNWFFHKIYWTGWISTFHKRRRRLAEDAQFSFFSAQAVGLIVLGLTSVYREGFETVLFLQSLQLSAGTAAVFEGAALGLGLTAIVGVITFFLQRKLPYKRMLIITGITIGYVLVVMVGQTVRTLQGTGWMPITPVDLQMPYWTGQWFGLYPTVETLLAQALAAVFVIGSYYLAEEVRIKRPRRRAKRAAAQDDGAQVVGDLREPAGAGAGARD